MIYNTNISEHMNIIKYAKIFFWCSQAGEIQRVYFHSKKSNII